MSNNLQLIELWFQEKGKPDHKIQASEDGRGGVYTPDPENKGENRWLGKSARDILVGEVFYFQDIKKSFIVIKNALWMDNLWIDKRNKEGNLEKHKKQDDYIDSLGKHENGTGWQGAALTLYDKNGYEYPCDFNKNGELVVAFRSKRLSKYSLVGRVQNV